MKVLFLHSLEKKVGEDRTRQAQASIGENKGQWVAGWQETKEDGRLSHETWFEGAAWDEMIVAFRENLLAKQLGGFLPIFDMGWLAEGGSFDTKTAKLQLLQYYSENNPNEAMYEELRQWRLKQASAEGKSPFLVATNRLLRMISTFLPQSEEELLQLPGFGSNKVALYGAELLRYTQSVERSTSFPLGWVQDQIDPVQFYAWQQQEKERKRQAEQNKREVKLKLLEAITGGDSLEQLREQLQLQRRDLMIWLEELDREGYDLESYIEKGLQQVPSEELSLAWTAFELKGDRYLKPILQTLYNQDELEGKDIDHVYEWLRLLRMKFRRHQMNKEAAAAV
ncbi:aldolase [Paenibacillus sp. H1-7]|uniref:HRDC domain-containing protein n=1 Tax=Paenibacillus sp. H1-7 TaxID=2282849 RepID=UPI001EF83123|nr:HRDC domain-containing protein [Paenibacillus sp. H1-7]ULL14200.1 aldolase [Paenibacillus sp. H1-7]